ncbi:MAG: DUF2093 domain-containing protein [Marinomonas sp.]
MLMSSKNGAPGDDGAKLRYEPGSFRVIKPGTHVYCAMSGVAIRLEDLCYWSAEFQEAYATCQLATERLTQQVMK